MYKFNFDYIIIDNTCQTYETTGVATDFQQPKLITKTFNQMQIRRITMKCTNLPTSKAGDAIGDRSTSKNTFPSVGLLGCGFTTSQVVHASTLPRRLCSFNHKAQISRCIMPNTNTIYMYI